LRIEGVAPVVSTSAEAFFVPNSLPKPLPTSARPPAEGMSVRTIAAGKTFAVDRGKRLGPGRYEHLNARSGTIEVWVRPHWSEDDLSDRVFLRCGQLTLYRRSKLGTYVRMGRTTLQSGFVLRPGVWRRVAVTWDLTDVKKPIADLLIDGVPFVSVRYGTLEGLGDWTGPRIEFGTTTPLDIAGLHIRDTSLLNGNRGRGG